MEGKDQVVKQALDKEDMSISKKKKVMSIKVPLHAKKAALQGLKERQRNKAGLTKEQAKKIGVNSGVERAKQLITKKSISVEDAKSIARFYDRFKNNRTPRAETAIKLWGGRRFGRNMASKF